MAEPAIIVPQKTSPLGISGPGWPDARGWVIVGFFALEAYLLRMIELNDKLLVNASFMQLATTITAGGVLLIGMNMFGGTRAGTEMNAKVGDALTASVAQNATPTVIVTPPVTK